MEIVFISDKNYSEHLTVAIASILLNANKEDEFKFWILSNDLKNGCLDNLKKIKNFDYEIKTVDDDLFSDLPLEGICDYISIQTYYKYLLPQLLNKSDKALYLDVDICVRNSLKSLYETEFEDNFVVAVGDFYKKIEELTQSLDVKHYFNAGVMLLNLKKMREENVTKKLFENTLFLKQQNKLKFYDQCVFNYTLNPFVKFVSPKYNAQLGLFQTIFQKMYTEEELKEAIENPIIVHYTTEKKPWTQICPHPFAFEYEKVKFC